MPSAMHQYIGLGEFMHVGSDAVQAFGVYPFLLSSTTPFHLHHPYAPAGKVEGAVLVHDRLRRVFKERRLLQRREQGASRFHIKLEY